MTTYCNMLFCHLEGKKIALKAFFQIQPQNCVWLIESLLHCIPFVDTTFGVIRSTQNNTM